MFIKALQSAGIPVANIFETASNLKHTNKLTKDDESITSNTSIDLKDINSLSSLMKSSICKDRGSSFILTFDYNQETASAQWLSKKKKHSSPTFHPYILNAIYDKFKNYNHGEIGKRLKRIIGFTEYRLTVDEDDGSEK